MKRKQNKTEKKTTTTEIQQTQKIIMKTKQNGNKFSKSYPYIYVGK